MTCVTCHALLLLPESIKKNYDHIQLPLFLAGGQFHVQISPCKRHPLPLAAAYTVHYQQHSTGPPMRDSVPSPLQPANPPNALRLYLPPRTHQRACLFKGRRSAYSSRVRGTQRTRSPMPAQKIRCNPRVHPTKCIYAREMDPNWEKKKKNWRDSAQGNIPLNSHSVQLQVVVVVGATVVS